MQTMVWRTAVQRNACAYPIGSHVVSCAMAQYRRAVGKAALTRQVPAVLLKHLQLLIHTKHLVGVSEVRHERDFIDLR